MKALNKETAHKTVRPEKVIQFGEGNFLRAFVDWIIFNMNEKTDFNGSVVVVQPIEKGMIDMLNGQDCLYHVNLQGLDKGEPVNSLTKIDVISRALNAYTQFDEFMKLAEQPEIRFVISNTTEAGITFDPSCKLTDAPASSYPGKLTQLLYHRYEYFKGDMTKGLIVFPCELIFLNGHKLKECILQYIDLWALGEEFKNWFLNACGVYATLVDRIVPGFPRKEIDDIKAKQYLISKCNELNLNLLCSMGAGNRYTDNPHFEVVDIFKTQNDALAKLLRKYCKEQGIKHLKVCYTPSLAIKSSPVGSISYYPTAMATTITWYVVNSLIKE